MWRVLVFFGLLCLAAYGAVWLANNPETVAVTWAGREYSTSLAVGVVGLIAVAILVSLFLGAIRAIVGLPAGLRRRARRRRQERGYAAITRGIVAVGAGDVAAARRHAGEAERLMGHEPLALLLRAQSAQASGQREAAEAAFREMAERPETKVLGLRGLYVEARRRGDDAAARDHAEEAARVAPAIAWSGEAVLEGLSAEGDWAGAVRLIERRTSLGLIDKATSRRQRAVLLTADAQSREERDPEGALATAEQAVKLAPDLVPAAALAGRLLSAKADLKRAARIIEAAWSTSPHPDLAGAYLNLRPGDSAMDRMRRAETLAKLSSWSDEARFAIARAAIEARELPRAREVLRPVLDGEARPTVRLCMAMAEIEGRGGQAGAAREWLARAARARRDKAWIADGVVSESWAPVSPVTGRLDAFRWDTPPEAVGHSDLERDPGIFEPDAPDPADEVPAFLGRTLAPPPASAESDAERSSQRSDLPSPAPAVPDPESASSGPVPPAAPPAARPPAAMRSAAAASAPTPIAGPNGSAEPLRTSAETVAPVATATPSTSSRATDAPRAAANGVATPAGPTSASPAPRRADPDRVESLPVTPAVVASASPPPRRADPNRADPVAVAPVAPVAPGAAVASASPLPRRADPNRADPPAVSSVVAPVVPGPAAPAPRRADPNRADPAGTPRVAVEPAPVVFPVRHAPDDPGPDGDDDRRQRFRLRV